jgi:hypothetical protein
MQPTKINPWAIAIIVIVVLFIAAMVAVGVYFGIKGTPPPSPSSPETRALADPATSPPCLCERQLYYQFLWNERVYLERSLNQVLTLHDPSVAITIQRLQSNSHQLVDVLELESTDSASTLEHLINEWQHEIMQALPSSEMNEMSRSVDRIVAKEQKLAEACVTAGLPVSEDTVLAALALYRNASMDQAQHMALRQHAEGFVALDRTTRAAMALGKLLMPMK